MESGKIFSLLIGIWDVFVLTLDKLKSECRTFWYFLVVLVQTWDVFVNSLVNTHLQSMLIVVANACR